MRPRTQLTSQINLQCVEWGVVRLVDARALREAPIVKPTLQALCRLFICASDLADAAYQTATV